MDRNTFSAVTNRMRVLFCFFPLTAKTSELTLQTTASGCPRKCPPLTSTTILGPRSLNPKLSQPLSESHRQPREHPNGRFRNRMSLVQVLTRLSRQSKTPSGPRWRAQARSQSFLCASPTSTKRCIVMCQVVDTTNKWSLLKLKPPKTQTSSIKDIDTQL